MNRAALRTEVRYRIGEEVEDFWKTAEVDRALNEALVRFSSEERWPWLVTRRAGLTLASGTNTLVLEDEVSPERHFNIMLQATGEDPFLPDRVSAMKGFQLRTTHTAAGRPLYYYVQSTAQAANVLKTTVSFVPTPNKAYSLEYQYIRRPVPMTDDAHEPDIPSDYEEAVIAWAAGILWLKELNGAGKAQEQFNLYNSVLDQARQDVKELPADGMLVWGAGADRRRKEDTFWSRLKLPLGS